MESITNLFIAYTIFFTHVDILIIELGSRNTGELCLIQFCQENIGENAEKSAVSSNLYQADKLYLIKYSCQMYSNNIWCITGN